MATNAYLSASVAATLAALSVPDDFVANGDGSYTYTESWNGNTTTFTSADLIALSDNGDATWTMTLPDGVTTVDIDVNQALGNLTAAGVTNLMAALDFNLLTTQQQQDLVDAISSNPAAMATLASALGSDALVDNADGTYTHTAFDGTVLMIDTNAASASIVDSAGNYTATNVEDALVEIAGSLANVDTDISAAALSVQGVDLEVKVTEDGVDRVGLVPLASVAAAFPAGSIPASALAAGAADTDVSGIDLSVVGTNLQVKVSEDGTDYIATLPLSSLQDADTDISAAALAVQGTDLAVKVTEDGVDRIGLVALSAVASAFPAGSIPASALASGAADTDVSGIDLSVVGTNLQVKVTEDGTDYTGLIPLSALQDPDTDISAAALSVQGTDLAVKVTEDGVDRVGLVPLATIAAAFPAGTIPGSALAAGSADTDISGVTLSVAGTNLKVTVTEDGVDYSGTIPLSAIGSPDSIDDDTQRAANAYLAGDQLAIAKVGGVDEKVNAGAYVANIMATHPLGYSGTPSLSQLTAASIAPSGPPFNMYIDDSVCPNVLMMWDSCENGGAGGYIPVGSGGGTAAPASWSGPSVFNYTGSDQLINSSTVPQMATATQMRIRAVGAGGLNDHGTPYIAGPGGYAEAVFPLDGSLVVNGTALTNSSSLSVMVGRVGVYYVNNPYGFGGSATYVGSTAGAGLSGVFMGSSTIQATHQARALLIAGGGSSADYNTPGRSGGSVSSGGQPTMRGASGANGNGAKGYPGAGGGYKGGSIASSSPNGQQRNGGSSFIMSGATGTQMLFSADGTGPSPVNADPDFGTVVGNGGSANVSSQHGRVIVDFS